MPLTPLPSRAAAMLPPIQEPWPYQSVPARRTGRPGHRRTGRTRSCRWAGPPALGQADAAVVPQQALVVPGRVGVDPRRRLRLGRRGGRQPHPGPTERPRPGQVGGSGRVLDGHALEPAEAPDGGTGDQPGRDRAPALAADGQHHLGRDHPGEDQHRPDRQVDPGRDDHEGHADGDDQQPRGVGGDVAEVEHRGELLEAQGGEAGHDAEQDQEGPGGGLGQPAAQRRPDPGGLRRLGRLLVGRRHLGEVAHATSSLPRAPVMAAMTCSMVVSAAR